MKKTFFSLLKTETFEERKRLPLLCADSVVRFPGNCITRPVIFEA